MSFNNVKKIVGWLEFEIWTITSWWRPHNTFKYDAHATRSYAMPCVYSTLASQAQLRCCTLRCCSPSTLRVDLTSSSKNGFEPLSLYPLGFETDALTTKAPRPRCKNGSFVKEAFITIVASWDKRSEWLSVTRALIVRLREIKTGMTSQWRYHWFEFYDIWTQER